MASDWILDKVKGSAVDLAAATAAIETTSGLQRLTDRTRPNGTNDMSLPSGHTTTSAAYTQLASRNLDVIDLDPSARRALDFGLGALTVGTAWARVEAGEHFPADTLVGIAIGSFFGHWFDAAFPGAVTTIADDRGDYSASQWVRTSLGSALLKPNLEARYPVLPSRALTNSFLARASALRSTI